MQMINVLSMAALASAIAIDRRAGDNTTQVSFYADYPCSGIAYYSDGLADGDCFTETKTNSTSGAIGVTGTNSCVTFYTSDDCTVDEAGDVSHAFFVNGPSCSGYSIDFTPGCTKIETNVGSECPSPTTSEPETCTMVY